MDAWKKCVRSAGKALSIKLRVFGGGGIWVLGGGGGKCRFYFYGRADFSVFEGRGIRMFKGILSRLAFLKCTDTLSTNQCLKIAPDTLVGRPLKST